MSLDLFNAMVDSNREISRIVFCGHGEPLAHPGIYNMIRYAAAHNIRSELNTNALLLDVSASKEIVDSGLDAIAFSFDSFDADEYQGTRLGAIYNKVLTNITAFVAMNRKKSKRRISMAIDCVDFGRTFRQRCAFRRECSKLGIANVNFLPLHSWPAISRDAKCHDRNNPVKHYRCFLPWVMLSVLWDGRVAACCDDFNGINIVGDLSRNISVSNVWNGDKMRLLRAKLASCDTNDLVCSKCDRLKKNPWKYPILDKLIREMRELLH